jgi:hypothetical protein
MSTRNIFGVEGVKGLPALKADITAICEVIVCKLWETGIPITMWASTVCYTDNSIFTICRVSDMF